MRFAVRKTLFRKTSFQLCKSSAIPLVRFIQRYIPFARVLIICIVHLVRNIVFLHPRISCRRGPRTSIVRADRRNAAGSHRDLTRTPSRKVRLPDNLITMGPAGTTTQHGSHITPTISNTCTRSTAIIGRCHILGMAASRARNTYECPWGPSQMRRPLRFALSHLPLKALSLPWIKYGGDIGWVQHPVQ